MEMTREQLKLEFQQQGYICGDDLITTVYLALRLEKPLLVTGAPGVGKTEIAKVLSKVFKTELIRLQCYEGLDENKALYEWNYQRQLLHIQAYKEQLSGEVLEKDLFSLEYLLERPLLKAIMAPQKTVLLIDEIDKTDQEFEAFLFEILSDFQVSIPELGTLVARHIPIVILTSNGERELSDGLKRRCAFLYIDYPGFDKEMRIIQAKVPGAGEQLAMEVAKAVQHIRAKLELKKKPAIAETLDWTRALLVLAATSLEPELVRQTLNLVLKDREDQNAFHQELGSVALCEAVHSR